MAITFAPKNSWPQHWQLCKRRDGHSVTGYFRIVITPYLPKLKINFKKVKQFRLQRDEILV